MAALLLHGLSPMCRCRSRLLSDDSRGEPAVLCTLSTAQGPAQHGPADLWMAGWRQRAALLGAALSGAQWGRSKACCVCGYWHRRSWCSLAPQALLLVLGAVLAGWDGRRAELSSRCCRCVGSTSAGTATGARTTAGSLTPPTAP